VLRKDSFTMAGSVIVETTRIYSRRTSVTEVCRNWSVRCMRIAQSTRDEVAKSLPSRIKRQCFTEVAVALAG